MQDVNATATGAPEAPVIPDNYQDFKHWRETGEVPKVEEIQSDATETPRAETEPESDPEEQQEQTDSEDKPKGKGLQKRFDKLTKKIHELEAKLAEKPASGKADVVNPESAKTPEGKPVAPKLEDFADWNEYKSAENEYLDKLTDWKIDQREKASKAKAQQDETADQWSKRTAQAKATLKDFDEVMQDADIPISPAMQQAIVESELGPQLAYHLAKNPADAERIAKLSPIAAARELGKLEASLTAESAPKPQPKLSRAPDPITPVSKSSKTTGPSIHDPETASDYQKWKAAREAQLKRK